MEITSAEFVISNTDVRKCPTGVFPEYAFIGRSNVGKSSLINMLTARKGLAMTSATPGKTMLINHFLINQSWYLVDLPGYGYARRGQKGKDQIRTIIEDYILEREPDDKPVCTDRQSSGASENRSGIYGMVRRKRHPFLYHLHQSRQVERRTSENEYQRLSARTGQAMGRTPSLFRLFLGRPHRRTEILDYIENISKELYKNK